MTRTPEVGRPRPGPSTDRAVARWVELAHEIVADTGDDAADAAVDAAVDWIAAVLVGGPPPGPLADPRTGVAHARPGSSASCSAAAARLLTLVGEVEAHEASRAGAGRDGGLPGPDGPDGPDGPEWTRQVRELAHRLQQHATLLASDPVGPDRAHVLGMSAARVRRAALACRLPRGGPALPFRP